IIVMSADIAQEYAISRGWREQLVRVNTAEEGLKLLASGQHDAMLLSKLVGSQILEKLKLENIKALNIKTGFSQKFSFAVHKGETELLAEINEGMALTKANGVYDALYEKWFGVHEEVTLAQTLRKYSLPIALILLVNVGIAGYIFYKRRIGREQIEAARQEALDRLQRIASQLPGVIFQYRLRPDGSSCVPFASEALRDIYRLSPEEVREDASPIFALIHPEDLDGLVASVQVSAQNLTPWRHEYRVKFDDGTVHWLFGNALPQKEKGGSTLFHGFITDITERKLVETELHVAATAFESQEGMLVTNAENVILRVNHAFTKITGYTAGEVVGQTPSLLKSDRHDADFYAAMWESIKRTGGWRGEIWNRRKNGEVHPVWLTITAVTTEDGTVTHYIATHTDITSRKAAEDEIRQLAFYDFLTQLPNRRLMIDRLQQALASGARSRRQSALLFIDLDNFKTLNDTLGHDIGDLLLQQVAQRLSTCVRKSDTVARLGGDEFVVVLVGLSENAQEAATQAETVGEKILAALNKPYQIAGHDFNSTPSIGITLSSSHLETVDDLLKRADIAMYQAKAAGRNTLRFFDPQMQAAVNARVKLEKDLRQALAENQFELYYQAQVYHNRQIISAEVLLRWAHPEHGMILPLEFIPLAEETGLILPIGQWVLETVCAQLKAWEADVNTRHLQLAVNVSPRQFRQANFVNQVHETLLRSKINPDRLELELTETLVLDNIDDAIIKMHALKEIGLHFSMDDFGTGYSSLAYLTQLPLDKLKIDKSFVHNIGVKSTDAIIVQTIIGMASNLGMEVVAEGVETEEQRKFLEQHGCPVCQGYLFSKPVTLKEFEKKLEKKPKTSSRK
ncbi:MAG TPA: EAL domain-containing protein, partial [Methylophilaceae bacterium]|nr:EAL domain-containing protein [Methylophilaceae bacterium]